MNRNIKMTCFFNNGQKRVYKNTINILEYSDYQRAFVESCEEEAIELNIKVARFII